MKIKIIRIIKLLNVLVLVYISMIYIISKTNIDVFNNYNKNYITNNNKYYEDIVIEIPKINLYNKVYKAKDNFSNLNNNIVYYKNFDVNNKIILFAHSGIGYGTYFNKIDELNDGDRVYLYYKDKRYEYYVHNTFIIDENTVDILNEEEKSNKLLLITCDKKHKDKRIVVQLFLKGVKNV